MIDDFAWEPGVTPLSDGRIPTIVSLVYVAACCAHNRSLGLRDKAGDEAGKGESSAVKLAAAVHNAAMVLFSTFIFLVVLWDAYFKFQRDGVYDTLCPAPLAADDPRGPTLMRGRLYFWCYVYYVSKYYELVDTALMAAMGKHIIPLHIWHYYYY